MTNTRPYAVITGASSGIGYALAEECARAGFSLFLVSRDKTQLEEAAQTLADRYGVTCYSLAIDLTHASAPDKIITAATSHGSVTHLINNAGFGDFGTFATSDWQRQAAMIQLNITALTHLTRLFLPSMVSARQGKILNIASLAAFLPGPYMSVYYATKHFVLAFSEGLAEELKDSGVAVTTLCPGPTHTKFESTAHMQSSKLYSGKLASTQLVARVGFSAMQTGKRVALVTFRDKLYIWLSGFVPRKTRAASVARAQSQKQ